jgi:hypothetical protein
MAPSAAAGGGRDPATGRFAAGWKGGSGNPHARQVAERRKALLAAVTAEDVAAIARKLCELAMAGDTAAAKIVLLYTIGRPAEAVNPDHLDLQEFRLLGESPDVLAVSAAAYRCAPAVATTIVRQFQAKDIDGYLDLNRKKSAELEARYGLDDDDEPLSGDDADNHCDA